MPSITQTAESRFRGGKDEFQASFLATHYIIERHREALLWSYFVGRADTDRDGRLSYDERQRVLRELGPVTTNVTVAHLPIRSSVAANSALLTQAGLSKPLATTTSFDSRDGFAFFRLSTVVENLVYGDDPGWPVREEGTEPEDVCSFGLNDCLSPAFASSRFDMTAALFFRWMAFTRPACGE